MLRVWDNISHSAKRIRISGKKANNFWSFTNLGSLELERVPLLNSYAQYQQKILYSYRYLGPTDTP